MKQRDDIVWSIWSTETNVEDIFVMGREACAAYVHAWCFSWIINNFYCNYFHTPNLETTPWVSWSILTSCFRKWIPFWQLLNADSSRCSYEVCALLAYITVCTVHVIHLHTMWQMNVEKLIKEYKNSLNKNIDFQHRFVRSHTFNEQMKEDNSILHNYIQIFRIIPL